MLYTPVVYDVCAYIVAFSEKEVNVRTIVVIYDVQTALATGDTNHETSCRLPLFSVSPRLPSQLQSITIGSSAGNNLYRLVNNLHTFAM